MQDSAAKPEPHLPKLTPIEFSDVPGWQHDTHLEAAAAFAASLDVAAKASNEFAAIAEAYRAAPPASDAEAKRFFETHFTAHQVEGPREGLLTGYFEPEFHGALHRSEAFAAPVLARPPDLINLLEEAQRGARPNELTHARRLADGSHEPYATRAAIDEGALAGQGLELCYLADPVDVFTMQVQGSGLVRLPDGSALRLIYDGKNGHPYSSVGKVLIEQGIFSPDTMQFDALVQWLKADLKRAEPLLWRNHSYVFFRVLGPEETTAPLGTDAIALQPLRSVAVDTASYPLGLPIVVSAPTASHLTSNENGFHRLMMAHDVGSAITGPQRGDVFCGSGNQAGSLAGITKHPVQFYPLLPKGALVNAPRLPAT